ncbi:MAG: hypothetical protein MUF00_10420 [Gemmatimonadaceae bacterium]|jgi:hypothetical protein|nr:hypothetical protein [Gemmatimonadaceae bacterium]
MTNTRACFAVAALLIGASSSLRAQAIPRDANAARDSADAVATFRENLDAIHKRNRARYLATYVHSPQLTRHGLRTLETGYAGWSAITDNSWPDTLMVRELRVTPVAPGVVYGYYRYIGVNQGTASTGVSTRLFVRTPEGMRITVTASWPDTLPVPPR